MAQNANLNSSITKHVDSSFTDRRVLRVGNSSELANDLEKKVYQAGLMY